MHISSNLSPEEIAILKIKSILERVVDEKTKKETKFQFSPPDAIVGS